MVSKLGSFSPYDYPPAPAFDSCEIWSDDILALVTRTGCPFLMTVYSGLLESVLPFMS